jgi:hypothetical protein
MPKTYNHLRTFAAVTLGAYLGLLAPIQSAGARVLQGSVQDQSTLKGQDNAPGLSRTDIKSNGDPFSNGDDQQQFAPASFAVEQAAPPMPPPKKAFGLNADTDGDAFNPQMGNAMPDRAPQQQQPHQAQTMTPNQFNPQDPDSSREMQLLWDAWHKRVADAVYQRYSGLSNAAFQRSGRPLQASASYVVTSDGRIINVQLLVRSNDPIYNTLIVGVINSLSGDYALLQFPPGSRRQMVEKSATFSQNMGHEGYKFLTGDHETIQQKMQHQQQQMQQMRMQQQQFGMQQQQYGR